MYYIGKKLIIIKVPYLCMHRASRIFAEFVFVIAENVSL
ncbi:hypothetical protein Krac_5875 [Ktedonobacter racemifer DSM 44963]|uniref:Uncharacterized protein n=1 Tax=Ktedonobacter racemifer DSM 44963 TaxID=485913 RepID=D6TX37_KTERA|nr:hypothetical protein Krac_5875 [Ktedonobacter racemifer DSM 44963]